MITSTVVPHLGSLKVEPARQPSARSALMIGENTAAGCVHDGQPLTMRCPLDPKIRLSDCTIEWLQNGKVIYSFTPQRQTAMDKKNKFSRNPINRDHQFQCGQTVWRTYVSDGTCALATNTVHQTDTGTFTCRVYTQDQVYESEGEKPS